MPLSLDDALKDEDVWRNLADNPQDFRFPVAPHVHVAVEEWLPHVRLSVDKKGKLEAFGPMAEIIELLASAINFTYELARPSDGAWGVKLENDSWNGMVGMLLKKEVDIGLGPFAMKEDRATVIEYTSAVFVDYYRLLVLQNKPEADPWGFLNVFNGYMWLGIFIAFFFIATALSMFPEAYQDMSSKKNILVFNQVVFWLMKVLLQQDLQVTSKINIIRVLFGTWFIFVVVVTKGYSGSLTSLLAARHIPRDIKSLRDVIDHPHLKVVLEGGSAISSFVQNSETGIFGELNKFYLENRILERRTIDFPTSLKTEISQGDSVLILEDLSLRSLLGAEFSVSGRCDFYMPNDYFLPWIFCMIGPQKNPLNKAISFRLERITTTGLYSKWLNQMLPNGTVCANSPSVVSVSEPYSINGLWGIFVMLIFGLMASIVIFIVEILLHQFMKRRLPTVSDMPGRCRTLSQLHIN